MSFWGPLMSQVLAECDKRGIAYDNLSPAAFLVHMNQLTGCSASEYEDPEFCALQWLQALEKQS